MRVAAGIEELIGNTPLVELRRIGEKMGLKACLLAKLESKNPAGSAKDRVALEMIEKAEREGRLVNIREDIPKSFVLTEDKCVYVSQISPAALAGRAGALFDSGGR